MKPAQVDILGLPFSCLTLEEVLAFIDQRLSNGGRLVIGVGNVDMVMKARTNQELCDYFHEADIVIADGMPCVWAAHFFGTPLPERVPGTELVRRLGPIAAQSRRGIALVGGRREVAEAAAAVMRRESPGCLFHVVETPFPLDGNASRRVAAEIRELNAGIVAVALGAPRQELWLRDYLEESGALVGIGIGSAFDIISGHRPWAPVWMRNSGLEWLFRLALEPRRLGRRYLVDDLPFVWLAVAETVRARLFGR